MSTYVLCGLCIAVLILEIVAYVRTTNHNEAVHRRVDRIIKRSQEP